MSDEPFRFDSVVILADESANWKIAGLRQLERLVLALNEFAETAGYQNQIGVLVFWEPKVPAAGRWLPDNSRFVRIRPMGAMVSLGSMASVLTTRLFVVRNGMREFLQTSPVVKLEPPVELLPETWQQLSDRCETAYRTRTHPEEEGGWRILTTPGDIAAAERQLLSRTGKAQDGLVSRYINRPLSRSITRFLLKFPIEPSTWTLSILVLPLVAFFFLVRGDYVGFVVGTLLFQIYNILDGCDGEIARAKYLDCEKGRRLDAGCDLIANLLFVLCLGVGLFRQPRADGNMPSLYLLESIIACFVEGFRLARYAAELTSRDTTRVVSRRQEGIVIDSSRRVFGKTGTLFLIQVTKRDVGFFAFFLLALAGVPSWILHFFFLYAVGTLLFALKDLGPRSQWRGES